ncbi:MAG: hypothetical protein PHF63_04980 [Herbinix sp.]|nr:hypothetical protein [Herbinix sp.]
MIQAYNYLLENFPAKRAVMYPAKNRKELKKVYDDIVSLSKRSPYCKIDLTKENQEYAIGVKESALELKSKLNNILNPQISGFQSKTVSVSDESILSAKLLNENTENLPSTIQIQVNTLANVQVNRGKELMHSSYALPVGKYNFQVDVLEETYPLTFVQKDRVNNEESIKNMADFLNQSVPGINASVEKSNSREYSRILITSDMSGRFGEKNYTFEDTKLYGKGVVDFFGLNRMEKASACADFELNGVEKQTATNTFTLENTLHISLHNSAEQPVTLRITPDSNQILTAVDSCLSTYNSIIGLAKDRTLNNKEHYSASKLIGEMKSLEKLYGEELTACGIRALEDGTLKIDDSLAVSAAEDGGMESLFTRENGFIARLMDKAEAIAINPMEYLEKTIVTYPNNEKNSFNNPYVTSMYSGLFFNSYC